MTSGPIGDATLRNSQLLRDYGTTSTGTVGKTNQPTGSGTINAAGQAPDAPPTGVMGAVMQSVFAMIPKMTGQALDVLLLQVTTKMKDTIDKTEKTKIDTDTGAKRVQIGEKQAKLEEATKKIQEAEDKMKNLSVWDKIKLAFQYIGAILSIIAGIVAMVAGAAAMATGVASPAGVAAVIGGVALIAAGVLMLGMAADATYAVTNKDGLGFVGAITKEVKMSQGESEEDALKDASKADMIARVTVGAIAAVLAIGGGLATIGVSGPALVGTALGIVSCLNSLATASGDLVVGVMKRDAQEQKSDGMNKQADGKRMEAMIQSLDDMIDMALSRLKGAGERFDAMLDSLTDSIKDRGDTLSRVNLRA